MVKKLLKYIFIYTLLVGCDSNSVLGTCDSNCYLDISAPDLEIDNNEYHHMTFLNGYPTKKYIWDMMNGQTW